MAVIPARELVSSEALRRYDDNGEPVYTATERVLLALRWFDWVTRQELYDALDGNQRLHWQAIKRLVRRGWITERDDGAIRLVRKHRIVKPANDMSAARRKAGIARRRRERREQGLCTHCKAKRADGKTLCEVHLLSERSRSRANHSTQRRAA